MMSIHKYTGFWVTCCSFIALLGCWSDGAYASEAAAPSTSSRFLQAEYVSNIEGEGFSPEEIAYIEDEFATLRELKITHTSALAGCLNLSADWPIGAGLLQACSENIAQKGKKFQIIPGPSTNFAYKRHFDTYVIEINVEQLKKSRVACVIPGSIMVNEEAVYRIGSDANPGYIVLGHELCHALHALNFPASVLVDPTNMEGLHLAEHLFSINPLQSHGTYDERRKGVDRSVWPDPKLGRSEELWCTSEEQLTVIGLPMRGPQYSEFYLRLAAGYLPRYGYRSSSEHFFESRKTIESMMVSLLGPEWQVVLDQIQPSQHMRFEEETALASHFNPWYVSVPRGKGVRLDMLEEEALSPSPKAKASRPMSAALLARLSGSPASRAAASSRSSVQSTPGPSPVLCQRPVPSPASSRGHLPTDSASLGTLPNGDSPLDDE